MLRSRSSHAMNIPYDLNLAVGYTCALAILCWTGFWLVPLAMRTIVVALRELTRSLKGRGRPAVGAKAQPAEEHWWGPHSASH
jgi:hypothetical protein